MPAGRGKFYGRGYDLEDDRFIPAFALPALFLDHVDDVRDLIDRR